MKTLKDYRLILSLIALALSSTHVHSYPPDNAAVLYYKAAMLYEVDSEMSNLLSDFRDGKIELNDKIRQFVSKNTPIIQIVLDASEIKNCDWGLNFSDGIGMKMPILASFRKITHLIIADSKILAHDGNYEAALNRCISLCKIARHLNGRVLVNCLIGIAIQGAASSNIVEILSNMPQNAETLTRLKNQLAEIDSTPLSIKPALLGERDIILAYMTPQRFSEGVDFYFSQFESLSEEDEAKKQKMLSFDANMISRNRKYFEDFYTCVIAAFDMPYPQGYAALIELIDVKTEKDIENNPDATVTAFLRPAAGAILSIVTRSQTHDNAIKTAIEVYLIKAQTGKLPDSLPEGLPSDLFSGMDFEYEKTADGFVLRCQGKAFGSEETHQYEFKVQ
ncbi:MAG: hypothetical protein WCZ89_02740 [Phycisphaerae bacterium]